MIHLPEKAPETIPAQFPGHLHMNLLPIIQGEGMGGLLFKTWMQRARDLGVTAAHIGANANNERAISFWQKQGLSYLGSQNSRTVWMGRPLR